MNEYIVDHYKLTENSMYAVFVESIKELCILYCYEDYDKSFSHHDVINTNEINIGSSKDNHIIYKNSLVSFKHARLFKDNEQWYVENYDTKYGTFVNNMPILNKVQPLYYGDIIFIIGLKIIVMPNSLYINNPKEIVHFDNMFLPLNEITNTKLNKNIKYTDINYCFYKQKIYY